jgi:hypothetical protein
MLHAPTSAVGAAVGGVAVWWLQLRASRRDDGRRADEAVGTVIKTLQAGLAEVRIDLASWRELEGRCQERLRIANADSRTLHRALLDHGIPVPPLPSEQLPAE